MTDTPTTPKPPAPPADLVRSGPGRQLWRSVVGTDTCRYILTPAELEFLHAACVCKDEIAALRRKRTELEKNPRFGEDIMRGSMGQPVENPLHVRHYKIRDDIRAQGSALAGHMAKLNLPDEDAGGAAAGVEQPRSVGARNAAQSRWGKSG